MHFNNLKCITMNTVRLSSLSSRELQSWFNHWKKSQHLLHPFSGTLHSLSDKKGIVYCQDVFEDGSGLLIIKAQPSLQTTLVLDGISHACLYGINEDLEVESKTKCHSPNTSYSIASSYPYLLLLPEQSRNETLKNEAL
jgi:hypothetical protein